MRPERVNGMLSSLMKHYLLPALGVMTVLSLSLSLGRWYRGSSALRHHHYRYRRHRRQDTLSSSITPEAPLQDPDATSSAALTISNAETREEKHEPAGNEHDKDDDTVAAAAYSGEYRSLQEKEDRVLRFPSVEDRVRIYMSTWYIPPCLSSMDTNDNNDARVQFNYPGLPAQHPDDYHYHGPTEKLYIQELPVSTSSTAPRLFQLQGLVRTDTSQLFYLHSAALQACPYAVCKDVLDYVYPYTQSEQPDNVMPTTVVSSFSSSTSSSLSTLSLLPVVPPPILLDLGDKPIATAYQPKHETPAFYPQVPFLKKFRAAYTVEELRHMTLGQTCSNKASDRRRDAVVPELGVQPIVWKFKSSRHYGILPNITEHDIPYVDKRDQAIFRGRLAGIHKMESAMSFWSSSHRQSQQSQRQAESQIHKTNNHNNDNSLPATHREWCLQIPRCRLVLMQQANAHLIDARLVGPRKGLPDALPDCDVSSPITTSGAKAVLPTTATVPHTPTGCILFADERMSLAELLQYKIIIMMEGNDVASGLKWALYSNSVVILEEPITVTSWAMEERLKPWIHYVPMTSVDRVHEQVQWILDNPVAAQRIAHNGALWIKDLVLHPQAAADEERIYMEMMQRYQTHFAHNPYLL